MNLNKILIMTVGLVLALTLISINTFSVLAQVQYSEPQGTTWIPPHLDPNWVNPVTAKIKELRTIGLSDTQISSELSKLGMGWCPRTGSTWLGRSPTPEEAAKLPPRLPPFQEHPSLAIEEESTQAFAIMGAPDPYYRGFGCNMWPGIMSGGSGETFQQCITSHVGSGGYWTEVGVVNQYGDAAYYFTYDNDEGGWAILEEEKEDLFAQDNYCIYISGDADENGWFYYTYLNFELIRTGYLPNFLNGVDHAKEAWSDTGIFTEESYYDCAHFVDNYIMSSTQWLPWNYANAYTEFFNYPDPSPVSYDYYYYDSKYVFDSWVSG